MSRNQFSGEMQIGYLVTQTRGLLGVRQGFSSNNDNFTIECTLAPDQEKFFLTLSDGDMVKLAGTVDQIDPPGHEAPGLSPGQLIPTEPLLMPRIVAVSGLADLVTRISQRLQLVM